MTDRNKRPLPCTVCGHYTYHDYEQHAVIGEPPYADPEPLKYYFVMDKNGHIRPLNQPSDRSTE